jgi:hypothetical protein
MIVFGVIVRERRRGDGRRDEGEGNGVAVIIAVMCVIIMVMVVMVMIMVVMIMMVMVVRVVMIMCVIMAVIVAMRIMVVRMSFSGVVLALDSGLIALGRAGGRRGGLRFAARIASRLTALVLFLLALHFGHESFAVGDRNLVVVGMDFGEGQEAVTVPAVVDESCLKRGLNPDDFRQVDVPFDLLLCRCLYIKFFKPGSVQNHDPGFLRVRGFDEHSFDHSQGYSVAQRFSRGLWSMDHEGSSDLKARVRGGFLC